MKRTGYIYEKLCDKALIREAIIKASRKKRRRKSVRRILNDIDHYVDEIYTMMLNEEFTHRPTGGSASKTEPPKKSGRYAVRNSTPTRLSTGC